MSCHVIISGKLYYLYFTYTFVLENRLILIPSPLEEEKNKRISKKEHLTKRGFEKKKKDFQKKKALHRA